MAAPLLTSGYLKPMRIARRQRKATQGTARQHQHDRVWLMCQFGWGRTEEEEGVCTDSYVEKCRNPQLMRRWKFRFVGFLWQRSRRIGNGGGWWNDEGVRLALLLMRDAVTLSDCHGD